MRLDDILYGYMKNGKIVVKEPWGGGGIFPKDTGLCNRLFHWEICEYINQRNGSQFQLLIEDDFWPERELLDLPNSTFISNNNLSNYYYKSENPYSDYTKISLDMFESMISKNDFTLEVGNNYQTSFGYNHIWDVYKNSYDLLERPIKNISLRHHNIQREISKSLKDVVGLHIRWGYGVNKSNEDLEYIKKFPIELPNIEIQSKNKLYDYVDQKKYINLIQSILDYSPTQMFYVSSDLGEASLVHIKNRFENNIITYTDIIRKIIHNHIETNIKEFQKNFQSLVNIIDLFSLAHCGIFYRYPYSSWSDFAEIYREIPTKSIVEDDDKLMEHYHKYSYWTD